MVAKVHRDDNFVDVPDAAVVVDANEVELLRARPPLHVFVVVAARAMDEFGDKVAGHEEDAALAELWLLVPALIAPLRVRSALQRRLQEGERAAVGEMACRGGRESESAQGWVHTWSKAMYALTMGSAIQPPSSHVAKFCPEMSTRQAGCSTTFSLLSGSLISSSYICCCAGVSCLHTRTPATLLRLSECCVALPALTRLAEPVQLP